MTFPAYPNYKSTGVEWLSEIPVHWELIRLRFLLLDGAEGIKIGPFGSQLTSDMLVEIGYKVYGQENVIAGDFDKGQRYITDEKFSEMSVYEISPNDLLVTMMGTAGRCKVVPEAISAGVMDSHLLRMRFGRKADPKFVELLIDKSIYVSHQVRLNGKGSIMHGLNSSIIKELLVALPSADEQASILSFLDHEIARIDALIEEQQRLIELLKEKRQAVISHAVTKGLDPNVKLKSSGVEWPLAIPAHWEILPLTRLIKKFVDYRGVTPEKIDSGIPLITASQIKNGCINHDLDPVFISEEEYNSRMNRGFPEVGDVLLTTEAPLGEVAMIEDAYVSPGQRMILMKTHAERITNQFLFSHFRSDFGRNELFKGSSGSTASGIRADRLRASSVLVPPIEEQDQIVRYIDMQTKDFDLILADIQIQLDLLKERRSTLISAAVTGKIDVHGLVQEQHITAE